MNNRLLALLEIIAATGPSATARDIAQCSQLPQATVYRLLAQLQELSLIEKTGAGFQIGHRLVRIAFGTISKSDVRGAIEPDLQALADATGETSFAARLTANGVELFVRHLADDGRHGGVVPPLGLRPVVCSAAKAILAHLGDSDRRKLIETTNAQFPDFIPSDEERLEGDLSMIAKGGLATCFGEENPDIGSVAKPIGIRGRAGLFSVGIVGPRTRIEEEWMSMRDSVESAASCIGRKLDDVA